MPPMDMSQYLSEIEHAATQLFPLVWKEAEEVRRLEAELKPLAAAVEREYRDVQSMAMYDDDDDGIATMRYWENYFGPDKERHHKHKAMEAAVLQLATHRFSIAAIAGNLLQYAKQGLSVVYAAPPNWPSWAAVGTQGFGNIILQARNQAMHWETPLSTPVINCFKKMAAEVNPVFSEYEKRSLAFEVVSQLDWRTFNQFARDMSRTV